MRHAERKQDISKIYGSDIQMSKSSSKYMKNQDLNRAPHSSLKTQQTKPKAGLELVDIDF